MKGLFILSVDCHSVPYLKLDGHNIILGTVAEHISRASSLSQVWESSNNIPG